MNIEKLKELIKNKRSQITNLETGLVDAETKEERAAINATLTEARSELVTLEGMLNAIQNETPADQGGNDPEQRGLNPLAQFRQSGVPASDDPTGTQEYRSAFMNLIQRGTPIPANLRADANTLTSDVAAVIPTHLVNQIIEKMDEVGMILPLLTRTSFKGGVSIALSSVKPVASWVAEGAGSDRQKKSTTPISFTYHKLRCEISMSMEVGVMALSAFEAKFVENVAKAMVYAIEKAALVDGNGTSMPKGILTETPETGNALTVAKAGKLTYQLLCDAEGCVPAEHEANAKWAMTKKTFMKFMGMTDTNGQPIARVNYGIGGKPERYLLGREVVINPYMGTYADTVEADTIFAAIVDFSDYDLNTVYDMGIQKKQDWDTEDLLTKAVMSVDGKLLDKSSLITITKTTA